MVHLWSLDPDNKKCSVPGCKRPAEKRPHHKFGRQGIRLLCDIRGYKAVCWYHHQRVKEQFPRDKESGPEWARSVGLLPPQGIYNDWEKMDTFLKLGGK